MTCEPNPTVVGYGGQPAEALCPPAGGLPATGADLLLLAAAAAWAIAIGYVLRLRRRPR